MRLPFLSRASHDEMMDTLREFYRDITTDQRATIATLQQQVADLTETIVSFKVSGASVVRAVVPERAGVKLERAPISAFEQAVDENKHASSSPALRKHLLRYASAELKKATAKPGAVLDEEVAKIETKLRTWNVVPNNADDYDDDDEDDDVVNLGGEAEA